MKKITAVLCSMTMLLGAGVYVKANDNTDGLRHSMVQKQGKEIKVSGKGNTRTIKCTGTETVSVEGMDNKVTIVGKCAKLEVEGKSNTVKAEKVVKISVEGAENMINADQVETISIEGMKNHVHYKKSSNKSGDADVTTEGIDNMVMKMK
ncbi:DUF3060 domain-containing protein [Sphingobacterium spiritivorum]|uniref:DUF3060 domain-containing protein n=1 Tax=Sphingobacterium spiritivorum TaxID=258 RepID=UPI003DA38E4F